MDCSCFHGMTNSAGSIQDAPTQHSYRMLSSSLILGQHCICGVFIISVFTMYSTALSRLFHSHNRSSLNLQVLCK